MGGERFFGENVQRQAQVKHSFAKVPEVVYSPTPSNPEKTDIETVRKAIHLHQAQIQRTPDEQSPQSFKEIVAPNEGDTLFQRLHKWCIRHNGNPENTIKILEALQVHRFQEIPKVRAKHLNKERKAQTNQTLKDTRLSSLIDYATDKTLYNETVHLIGVVGGLVLGASNAVAGDEVAVAISGVGTVLQAYCILAQRYSRARCERLINRALAKGQSIDRYEYESDLNLKLPQSSQRLEARPRHTHQ